ncbi:MAG: alpha/beta hydrolase [Planctomycetaceae bacterium]|jgi:acetyl esterase/lipase|nr:alpha/beta hydrolase [Planctomycetaceae bacterium]
MIMPIVRKIIAAFLFLTIFDSVATAEVRITNIPYVKVGGERQQLDIYLPDNYKTISKPLPVLLVIHGGGWGAGNKDVAAGWAHHYVHCGFAVVGINYRLKPDSKMPSQIIDCKSAIRWLRANAKEYNLDTKNFGAWGHSAGGQLSALLGTNEAINEFDVGEYLDQSSAVQAVAAYAAPTNFETWSQKMPEIEKSYPGTFDGSNDKERLVLLQKMSPVFQINKSTVPMLLVHAADDNMVPFSQSLELYDALQKAGIESRLIQLAAGDGGHGSKSFNSDETRKTVQQFFEKHLAGRTEPEKKADSSKIETKTPVVKSNVQETKLPKFILGPPGTDESRAIRELAKYPEQWEHCRQYVEAILCADHVLNRHFKNDQELRELFLTFQKMKIPFQLEVGAVKPWGKTGAEAFQKQQGNWQRFLRLGATVHGIAMDEPLNCCDTHLKMDNALEYAATETAEFIALVRNKYPDWTIGDIEGFPALTAKQVIEWIDVLETKLNAKNVRGLDFMRLDVDWMHFVHNTGKGSWADLKRVEEHCRKKKIAFSLVYWDAGYNALAKRGYDDDLMWYVGCLQMMYDYIAVGGNPDQVVVQSWDNCPKTFIPDNAPFTFTRGAVDIAERLLK